MKIVEKSIAELFPKVILARRYSTIEFNERRFSPRTLHNYSMSYYVKDGGAVIINGNRNEIKKGSVRFLRPSDISYSEADFECLTINFVFDGEDEIVKNSLLDSLPSYTNMASDLKDLFLDIISEYNRSRQITPLLLSSKVIQLISAFYEMVGKDNYLPNSIQQVQDYIREHYFEKITLEELGSICGYHPLHFLRLFKKYIGVTPNEYITKVRIENAKKIIVNNPNFSIEEIAEKCGYSSESHFKTLFKMQTSMTVGEYRKKQKFI